MPTRYLKPGIRDSELVDALRPLTECLFTRLIVTVDDFGRTDARPSMVKAACFPIKEAVTAAHCAAMLEELHKVGLITVYSVDGKPYLQMRKWDNHPRAAASKYPDPPHSCAQAHTGAQQPSASAPLTETGTETDKGAAPSAPPPKSAKKKGNPKFDAAEIELPAIVPRDVWLRWVKDRRKRGKPITEDAAALQLEKLIEYAAHGHTPESVVKHSIAGSFQGLYPPKVNGAAGPPIQPPKPWWETTDGVLERGASYGIKWTGQLWEKGDNSYEAWREYRDQVVAAGKAKGEIDG